MSTPKKRLAAITAAGALFVVGAGGVAIASWAGSGTGNAFAKATALPTGPTPSAPTTATQTSTSITVTWAKVQYTGTSTDVAGYVITRYKGSSTEAIGGNCTGTLSGTTTTCTDTVGGSGSYQYSVTPTSGAWTGTEGAKSGTVTVNAFGITSTSWAPKSDHTKGDVTFTGSGASGSNKVIVTVCATNSFPCASPVATPQTGNSPGNPWSASTNGFALNPSTTYYAQATQSGNAASPSAVYTFTTGS